MPARRPHRVLRVLRFIAATGAGAVLLIAPAASAQDYPTKPIRLIVAQAAGSLTDLIARTVAARMSDELGKQIVIENRPGGSGNIAAFSAARASKDGYTLLFASNASTMNMTVLKNTAVDVVQAFASIAMVATSSYILVVNPSVAATNLQELIDLAKAQPGRLNFATTQAGTATYLGAKLLEKRANVRFNPIFYKGSVEGTNDLLGGHVQVMLAPASSVLGHVKSGALRAIAFTGPRRTALAPDLPTMEESKFAGYQISSWVGILAPAGTPAAIVSRLSDVAVKAVKDPDVVTKLEEQGADPAPMGAPEFASFIKQDVARWAEAFALTGDKLQQ